MCKREDRIFRYNCVSPDSLKELNFIVDNMIEITYDTFLKNVNLESFQELSKNFGYRRDFHIKNDQTVTYHKCKLKNKVAYICCWSAIEHVFY